MCLSIKSFTLLDLTKKVDNECNQFLYVYIYIYIE